ncbi:Jag family protein [Umezakia ovalisporum]|jgi:spoIIIJ-associated protein|uniref:RNA-binding protein n=2 Tax=Umezakia ovalisporum TaxID=75695 RepID=A0AA43GVK4_9CYAN|nr:R3H domain-containing nucleic acid-binding protein [Umezakia ovalisporum]MBI1241360.1 RNA-binding protein [Nostoc sp. RI_552]MDH6056350.1 RNA-binding protein [Umezakia ovalisporum FSS-43]MDH6062439.1 RNA-binding protein [Umezakia ovalisporum FSS-62]MDH6068081.1 RNA-binding protein [Umezakia ovalisporum APH033B]MDH6069541.1 RNA-binding protein [Umezakia ovalisporum CobakiLakeA]
MMLDSPMQRGQQWLKTLLHLTGTPAGIEGNLQISPYKFGDSPEIDSYWLTINETNLTPEQIRILIGADGSVLDAIQYLANSVLNLKVAQGEQVFYTIELNGYRVKRQAEIRAIAEAAADKVRVSGREVEIKSLSSAERRQVHSFLKEFADLQTFSRGKEPHRHLVVCPARAVE